MLELAIVVPTLDQDAEVVSPRSVLYFVLAKLRASQKYHKVAAECQS